MSICLLGFLEAERKMLVAFLPGQKAVKLADMFANASLDWAANKAAMLRELVCVERSPAM